jgi:HTH-type transcriptional regulator/antitoxin HigA
MVQTANVSRQKKNPPLVQLTFNPPDPIEAIKFRMEQAGLVVKDLEPMIGKSNRVYEVLSKRRPLTLPMIRRLHKGLGIPAESLIGDS